MANTLLTPNVILKEALMVLHQELTFVGGIRRGYDDSYSDGAKIGDTLRHRRPVENTVTSGATMVDDSTLDTTEQKFTFQLSERHKIGLKFPTQDMTLFIDDFSERHIRPNMSKLAATVESNVLSTISGLATASSNTQKGIYNAVYAGATVNLSHILQARQKLRDNLSPASGLMACLDTQANVDLVNELKGLFQDSTEISKQYREGRMGRTAGFDFYENTLLPSVQFGTSAGTSAYLVNGANQVVDDRDVMTLNVDTGATTILPGQTFTIANVRRVHAETKADTGELQQFVVVGPASSSGASALVVSPGIVATGPRQNVTAAAADNAAITFEGVAGTLYRQSILHHPDAFMFGTADLYMPDGVDWKARRQHDGVSLRILRDYEVLSDNTFTRIDILYGYRTAYRQLACRILHT